VHILNSISILLIISGFLVLLLLFVIDLLSLTTAQTNSSMDELIPQPIDIDMSNVTSKTAMDTSWLTQALIAAIFGAISSVVITFVKYVLDKRKSEHDARRVYEHDARKRLYNEFEPLSFQLIELSEIAIRRIRGLAREASEGHLEGDSNWYSDVNNIRMINLVYRLLSPLAVFRLMQRKLTFTDIVLDKAVNNRYLLAKVLYYSFTHDLRLAKADPPITYKPRQGSQQDISKYPDIYKEQGIYYQSLIDTMADALIATDPHHTLRIISFEEFRIKYSMNSTHKPFDTIVSILENFHPKTRPVLWRILILQLYIYEALIELHNIKTTKFIPSTPIKLKKSIRGTEERNMRIDLKRLYDEKSIDEIWDQPYKAIKNYLKSNWTDLLQK
jgi:hypothetical protein